MIVNKKIFYRNLVLNMFLILISIINGSNIIYSNDPRIFVLTPFIVCFFLPIISALVVTINDLKKSCIYLLIDFLLISLFINNVFILFVTGLFTIIIGFIIGYLIKSKKNIGISTLVISLNYIFYEMIMFILYIKVVLQTSMQGYVDIVKENITSFFNELSANLSENPTLNKDNLEVITKTLDDMLKNLDDVFIAYTTIILFTCIIFSVVYYVVTNKLVKFLGYEGVKIKVFSCYYISNLLVAVIILLACVGVVLSGNGNKLGEYIYINARFILETLLILNGITFGYYFLIWKVKQPKLYALVLMIMSSLIIPTFVIGIGFVEVILDLRKLDPHRIFKKKSELK